MSDTLDRHEAVQQQALEIIASATDTELLIAVKTLAGTEAERVLNRSEDFALDHITRELERRYDGYEQAAENWTGNYDDKRSHAEFTLDWFGVPR